MSGFGWANGFELFLPPCLKGIFFIDGSFWSCVWKCVKHKGWWYSLILGIVHYFVPSFVIKLVSLLQILCLHRKYFLFSKNKNIYFPTPFFWKRTCLIIYVGSILNCNWGLALINPGCGVFVAVGFLIKVFMLIKPKGLAFWIYILVLGTRKFQWKSYCGSYGQQEHSLLWLILFHIWLILYKVVHHLK